jgi:hypothetical protein
MWCGGDNCLIGHVDIWCGVEEKGRCDALCSSLADANVTQNHQETFSSSLCSQPANLIISVLPKHWRFNHQRPVGLTGSRRSPAVKTPLIRSYTASTTSPTLSGLHRSLSVQAFLKLFKVRHRYRLPIPSSRSEQQFRQPRVQRSLTATLQQRSQRREEPSLQLNFPTFGLLHGRWH